MPPGMRRMGNGIPIPEAKIYRPTWDEFKDFKKFIEKIEADGAGEAGICKIIPPKEWVPRKAGYNISEMDFVIDRPVLQKFIQFSDRGAFQTKAVVKSKMTLSEYFDLCHEPNNLTPHHESYEELERKYWKSALFSTPIYGCDVAAPLSDPDLEVWNISKLGCILDVIKKDQSSNIQGVLSPYLYFGMWKATFSWHIEDLDLYAINVVHHGAPKTWYCVPPKYGYLLERAARVMFPTVSRWCSNFMRHKTCLISPQALDKFGVPYQKIVQEEREIIITFPYAYHQGFNHGFNMAESTNFARPSWVEYGKRSKPCDCEMVRVQFPMDLFVKEFQPDKYEDWINKRDIAPHPMDPPDVVKKVKLQLENPKAYAKLVANSVGVRKRKHVSSKKIEAAGVPDRKYISYDVYQHHELSNVLVLYNSETGRIRKGAVRLANFFDKPNVPQLIEKGYLIKVNVVKIPAKTSLAKSKNIKKKDTAKSTTENIPEQSPPVTPKKIKKTGDVTPSRPKKSRMSTDTPPRVKCPEGTPRSQDQDEKMEESNGPKFYQYFKTKVVNLLKLHHVQSGIRIKVFPATFKPAFNVPEELKAIFDINEIESLVRDGIFIVEGEFPTAMKKLANTPVHAPPLICCKLFITRDTNLPVKVVTELRIVLDAHLPHIKQLLQGTTLKSLLRRDKLIFFSKMRLRRRQPFERTSDDVLMDGYNPEDLIRDSDLKDEFEMEDDPEIVLATKDFNKTFKDSPQLEKVKIVTLRSKTKRILAFLKSRLSDGVTEHTFSLKDLETFTKCNVKSILSIIDVFEDLRLIEKRKSSELNDDITCVWKGIERNHLEETLYNIAQKSEPDLIETFSQTNSSLVKEVLRQIIKKLTTAKEGEIVQFEDISVAVKPKLRHSNRISAAAGVLQELGLIRRVSGYRNAACWNEKNPYQILPGKWKLQQSSAIPETSCMEIESITDAIKMRSEADLKDTDFGSEVESKEREVDPKRISFRTEEMAFRNDVNLKAMEIDTQAGPSGVEVDMLHCFEHRQVAEKTKEVVTSLMSKYNGKNGLCSFSLNDLATEASLHPQIILFILEMLAAIDIVEKEPSSHEENPRFTWLGTAEALTKILLINESRKSKNKRKMTPNTVLNLVVKNVVSRKLVNLDILTFNRYETKICKELFIAAGVLDALRLIHFAADVNVIQWNPPTVGNEQMNTCQLVSADFAKKTREIVNFAADVNVIQRKPPTVGKEQMNTADLAKKTREIVDLLQQNAAKEAKFSPESLKQDGIQTSLIHAILVILDYLQVIAEVPEHTGRTMYTWKGIESTALSAAFTNLMQTEFNGNMEVLEVLKEVLKQLTVAKEGIFARLQAPDMTSRSRDFYKNGRIVIGVLGSLGLVEFSTGNKCKAKLLVELSLNQTESNQV